MKNIFLIPNINKDKDLTVSKLVAKRLTDGGAAVYINNKYKSYIDSSARTVDEIPDAIDLFIVVGGDGSILDASCEAITRKIPILGINLGKLGYLSEVDVEDLEVLDRIFSGEYAIEEKMLLEVAHKKDNELVVSERLAVNDIIISHDTFLGIAEFRLVRRDGERVKYRADGIIFSTPVGSTAYSLSAGGPIVSHGIDSILVTPIAPHSFFNRSIIFSADEELKIINDSKTELKISVDGRLFSALSGGEECIVKTSENKLKVLTFNQNNTFSTLFKKMRILEDIK